MLVCLCKYLTLLFKSTGRDYRIYLSTFRVVCHGTPKTSFLSCSALKPCAMTMITLPIEGVTDVAMVALSCQPSELHAGQGPTWPSHNSIGTLVKFQRWMKWRATSRAAFPWTTEPISCQGILGVEYLSMKSARGARQGPITKFSAREQILTSTRVQHSRGQRKEICRKFNHPPTPLSLYMLSTDLQTRQGVMGFPFWSVGKTVGYLYTQTPGWAPLRYRSTVII